MKHSSLFSYLLLIFTAIIWGAQFAFNDIALQSMTPLTITVGRSIIGFITLGCCTLIFKPNKSGSYLKKNILLYVFIALFETVIPLFLIAWGLKHVNGSIAAILMSTIPIFTICISLILRHTRFNLHTVIGIILGFLGIIVLVLPNITSTNTSGRGVIAILIGSLCFAISLILIKKLTLASPIIHMRNILGIASVILIVISFCTEKILLPYPVAGIMALLILGIFCSGFVYLMFLILIQQSTPLFASAVNYLVPIVGVIIGYYFLDEHITWNKIIALICVLLALYQLRANSIDEQ